MNVSVSDHKFNLQLYGKIIRRGDIFFVFIFYDTTVVREYIYGDLNLMPIYRVWNGESTNKLYIQNAIL